MPMVNGKKYPYTGKGMMDAAAAKKKAGVKPPMDTKLAALQRAAKKKAM
jgi:hypothetical protein